MAQVRVTREIDSEAIRGGRDDPGEVVVCDVEDLQIDHGEETGGNSAGEIVVGDVESVERGESFKVGDGTREMVSGEVDLVKLGAVGEGGRDRPGEGVATEEKLIQIGKVSHLGRDGATEVVEVRPKLGQLGVANLWRHWAGEAVVVEPEEHQGSGIADAGRDASVQLVVLCQEGGHARHSPQPFGDGTFKHVVVQSNFLQRCAVAICFGDGAGELVAE